MVPLKGPEHGHVARNVSWRRCFPDDPPPPAQRPGLSCSFYDHLHLHPSLRPVTAREERAAFSPRGRAQPRASWQPHTLLHRPETADPARGSSDTSSWFPASFPPPVSPGLPQWRALSQEHKAAFALSPGERLHGDAADWPSSVLQQLGGVGLRGTAPRPSASQGKRECKHSAHLGRKRGKHSPGPRWTGSFQADS